MPRGILLVQSRPASAEDEVAYNRWYDEVHIPEILGIDGFRSARRLRAEDGESYLALYEVDDIGAAQAAMAEARAAGKMTRPEGVRLDPPPSVQWFHERATP
jgi:hypothetical protein